MRPVAVLKVRLHTMTVCKVFQVCNSSSGAISLKWRNNSRCVK
jgi:hypothetical protein